MLKDYGHRTEGQVFNFAPISFVGFSLSLFISIWWQCTMIIFIMRNCYMYKIHLNSSFYPVPFPLPLSLGPVLFCKRFSFARRIIFNLKVPLNSRSCKECLKSLERKQQKQQGTCRWMNHSVSKKVNAKDAPNYNT